MQKDITKLQKQVKESSSIDVIDAEIQDRLQRSSNLIVYGVDANVVSSDSSKINSLLGKINNLNLINISCKRTGKHKDNRPAPLLVKLNSKEDVIRVLKNKSLLPQGISVSSDKTKLQRDNLHSLYSEVDRHNNSNSNKKAVKFINGIPTIVSKVSGNNE